MIERNGSRHVVINDFFFRRVRVPISSEDLYNLEQSQPGAEKLALALLDRLFSR